MTFFLLFLFIIATIIRPQDWEPVWREGFVTDNGNHILDVHDLNISNPIEMETRLNQIPGILTVGIFAQRPADILLIADDTGVRELRA